MSEPANRQGTRPEPWQADVEVQDERAARLIGEQFPHLAPVNLDHLGTGWDNVAYLINGTWVFRFPRRHIAANIIFNEINILPHLVPRLPVLIPEPFHIGWADHGYPYSFYGYHILPGTTACSVALSRDDRMACAAPLADFLRCLHVLPRDIAGAAPGDDIERANMKKRVPLLLERLSAIEPHESDLDGQAIRAAIHTWSDAPAWTGEPRWVHGDLYARHLLANQDRQLCGVIDWGDVHVGDPAIDVSIAYSFLPAEARARFFASYGSVDKATRTRARYRALFVGITLMHYGRQIGDAAIHAAGRIAVNYALDD